MTDERIMERAKDASEAFRAERDRVREGPMGRVLKLLALIAQEVWLGEYHRQRFFKEALDGLEEIGFDVSGIDTEARPLSESVEEALENAIDDASSLYGATVHRDDATREMTAAFMVMSAADELMRAIADPMLDMGYFRDRLHDVVTAYIKAAGSRDDDRDAETGKPRTHRECGNCRYYFPGPVIGRERCVVTAWRGDDDVFVSPDQPGCERWRGNRASDSEE